jgi:hypothetical protein
MDGSQLLFPDASNMVKIEQGNYENFVAENPETLLPTNPS